MYKTISIYLIPAEWVFTLLQFCAYKLSHPSKNDLLSFFFFSQKSRSVIWAKLALLAGARVRG